MDFNDNKEEAAFRAEAAAWLKANAPLGRRTGGHGRTGCSENVAKAQVRRGWAVFVGTKNLVAAVRTLSNK